MVAPKYGRFVSIKSIEAIRDVALLFIMTIIGVLVVKVIMTLSHPILFRRLFLDMRIVNDWEASKLRRARFILISVILDRRSAGGLFV